MGENTALAVRVEEHTGTQLAAPDPYQPANFEGAWRLAKIIVASRLAPGLDAPEKAFVALATGNELGMSPMQSIRGIHIIEGRPALAADTMVALILRSGLCAFWTVVESTPTKCTIEHQRKGSPKPSRLSYTIEEAKQAGLTNRKIWQQYPTAMLMHRCAAMLARRDYPDLVLGMYDPDELVGTERPSRAVAPKTSVVLEDPPRAEAPIIDVQAAPASPKPAPHDPETGEVEEPPPAPKSAPAPRAEAPAWEQAIRAAGTRKEAESAVLEAIKGGADRATASAVFNDHLKHLRATQGKAA